MHELGVVFHCIKEVNKIAEENGVKKINSVTVEIGEVSTVLPYLFEDCLKDYPTVKYGKICPHCGSEHTYLLRGNELTIKQIEAVDTEE